MSLRHHSSTTLALAILMASACALTGARAAELAVADLDSLSDEAQLKAAYIDRILNFVQWTGPKADVDTLVIGVVGDNALSAALRAATPGRYDKPFVVCAADSARELADACRLIWIAATIDGVPRAAHPQWGDIAWIADRQVLTIGEDEGFTVDGGVIGLRREGDGLRFTVSTGAAERAGLIISSKILRLATIVP